MKTLRFIFASLAGLTVFVAAGSHACTQADLRYAQSSARVYIENGATCTPSQIDTLLPLKYSSITPGEVLEQLQPAVWLLKKELQLSDGSTIALRGTAIGGDADSFLLLSENGASPYHVKIQAKYGNVDIRSTFVSSWDPVTAGPDTDLDNGRAFIHINSYEAAGVAMESRMDIIDSEVSYLGFHDSESYGLVWKVRGGHDDHSVYDRVEVYGSIQNSYIHHNYMGMYSFGALGLLIDNNEVAYNYSYGIDPHDDSDELIITNNDVHDNGNHGIICSRRCNNLVITGNTSYRNRHGIMLHRDTNYTLVENNTVYDNRDNGIAIFESHYNTIRNNTLTGNRHGIRLSLGSHDNLIENNLIENSEQNGIYEYSGSDTPETTNGRPSNNLFTGNTLSGNGRLIKLRDSDDITLTGNTFIGITDIEIYDSTGIGITNNVHMFGALDIRVDGSSVLPSDVTMDIDENTAVKVTPYALVNLQNRAGRVLNATENSDVLHLYAETDSSGTTTTRSLLMVDSAMVGSSTLVTALPFWASIDSGEATMSRLAVTSSSYAWRSRMVSGTASTSFRIGNLLNNVQYTVLKNLQVIATLTPVNSEIEFTDTLTTTSANYVVQQTGTAITVPVAIDSYVLDGQPDANFGSDTTLETKLSGSGYTRESYMVFNIADFSYPVSNATLAVTAALSRAGSEFTELYDSSGGWDEMTMTWNTKPAMGSLLGSAVVASDSFQVYTFDITDTINQLILSGATEAGFALINPYESVAVTRIRSREYGSEEAPKLYIVP